MRKLLLGIVATVGLLSAPAAAQDVLDAQIADELPGLDLEESEFFPADGGAPAVAQKIFRSGNNVVTIAAQDFGPDQGIALAGAFRAAADGSFSSTAATSCARSLSCAPARSASAFTRAGSSGSSWAILYCKMLPPKSTPA